MVAFFDQTIAPERRPDPTLLPPESIARRRAMAERMLTEAGDYSPVQHWTQGAARVLGGAVGALGAYNADRMAMSRESAERGKGEAESAQAADILMGLYPGGQEGQAPAKGPDPQQFAQDRTAMARSMLTGGDPAQAAPDVMRSMEAPQPAPQPQAGSVLQGMPSYNQLKAMLGNPSTRAMGIEYLKEIQRRAMPPDEQTRLDMDLKRAQIAKMQRGDDQQQKEGATMQERALMLEQAGIDRNSPEGRRFLLQGDMGRSEGMMAGDRAAIRDADLNVTNYDFAIDKLDRALQLNSVAGSGIGTSTSARLRNTTGLATDQSRAAAELENILSKSAVQEMSQTLKGATTDRELFYFIEMAGDVSLDPQVRSQYINAAKQKLVKLRELAARQADEIRGGTYYGQPGRAAAPPAAGPPSAGPKPDYSTLSDDEILRQLGVR